MLEGFAAIEDGAGKDRAVIAFAPGELFGIGQVTELAFIPLGGVLDLKETAVEFFRIEDETKMASITSQKVQMHTFLVKLLRRKI